MDEYGDDAAALLAALGIEQVDVIGVSFGGMVAQHFAIRYPSMIRKLVLLLHIARAKCRATLSI